MVEVRDALAISVVKDDSGCEFVDTIASRLPVSIFMEFVGFPLDRLDDFRELAEGVFGAGSVDSQQAAGQIMAELQNLIQSRLKEPTDDLISKLISEDFEGRKLSFEELVSISFTLFQRSGYCHERHVIVHAASRKRSCAPSDAPRRQLENSARCR